MIPVTAFGGRETDQNKLMVFKAAECFCYTKQRTLNARIGEPMVDLDWSGAYQDYQKISGWQVGTRTREGFSGKYSETKTVTAVHTTEGDGTLTAEIRAEVDGQTISVDDADVQTILIGIAIHGEAK